MSLQRVLVIDDDAALLRMLKLSLQDFGFEVSTAVNGADALAKLETEAPNVVVLDIEMPVMDGRAFYRELRAMGSRIPVLVLSAYDARRAQRELHADAFMRKPFDPTELSLMLASLAGSQGE